MRFIQQKRELICWIGFILLKNGTTNSVEAYEDWVLLTSCVSHYQNIYILYCKNKIRSYKIDVVIHINIRKQKTEETILSAHSDVQHFSCNSVISVSFPTKYFNSKHYIPTVFFSTLNVYWYIIIYKDRRRWCMKLFTSEFPSHW